MLVTWTTLRTRTPVPAAPWQPEGATWWRAGHSGAGRLDVPQPDGRWWSVLATWGGRDEAGTGPPPLDGVDAWHVVLEPASRSGDPVVDGQPFAAVPQDGHVQGAAAVVTLAGRSPDDAREREFFRRFLHLGRGASRAPGHLASLLQGGQDGVVLTFSAWQDLASAVDWAYAQPQHAAAVTRQRSHRLVDASGSLRCAVLSSSGTLGSRPDPLAGRSGTVVRPQRAPA